jgi:hypothetical protein
MPVWLSSVGKWIVDRLVLKLVTALADWAGKYLPYILKEWKLKKERELAQKEAQKVLDEKAKDPKLSVDERAKAYEEFINSGRK